MSRHAFHDAIHPHAKVVLVIDGNPGVEHPDCSARAGVFVEGDCFYCTECRFNGRISGAWFMDKWRER